MSGSQRKREIQSDNFKKRPPKFGVTGGDVMTCVELLLLISDDLYMKKPKHTKSMTREVLFFILKNGLPSIFHKKQHA